MTQLRQLAQWPLRAFGLEPGRALSNARPDPGQRERDRMEQFRMISARFEATASATSVALTR